MHGPFERRLWSSRRYFLSDFRIATQQDELALDDARDVHRSQTSVQRVLGISTIHVHAKDSRRAPLVLRNVRRGAQLAALIELLAADPRARAGGGVADAARETMGWEPRVGTPGTRKARSRCCA